MEIDQKKLEELHLFFHNVAMDPTGELAERHSISYSNCQLRTHEDFLIAEGVCNFIIQQLSGSLSNKKVPDIREELMQKIKKDNV